MNRKNILSAVFGAVIASVIAVTTNGFSSSVSLLTGPQPGADLVSIINTLITNINANLAPGGQGTIPQALSVASAVGSVDQIQLTGGVSASNAATLGTSGSDANINLVIAQQGSGLIKMGVNNTTSGVGVTGSLSSFQLPATGAHTTIQGVFVFLDSSGISRYVPFL